MTSTLFVHYLPHNISEKKVVADFSKYGRILDVHVEESLIGTTHSRVTFEDAEIAKKVLREFSRPNQLMYGFEYGGTPLLEIRDAADECETCRDILSVPFELAEFRRLRKKDVHSAQLGSGQEDSPRREAGGVSSEMLDSPAARRFSEGDVLFSHDSPYDLARENHPVRPELFQD